MWFGSTRHHQSIRSPILKKITLTYNDAKPSLVAPHLWFNWINWSEAIVSWEHK